MARYFALLAIFVLTPLSVSFVDDTNKQANLTFSVVPVEVYAQSGTVAPEASRGASGDPTDLDELCSVWNPVSYIGGCLTGPLIYLSAVILIAAGAVFDFFIHFTLNPLFLDADYIKTTWTLMRDLANMAFILGIIVVAFVMITGVDQKFSNFKWKKLATRLVVVALLLNFSLFFTQVVIDTGNILGSFFYNRLTEGAPDSYMKQAYGEVSNSPIKIAGDTAEIPQKSPSAAIVNSLLLVSDGENRGLLDVDTVGDMGNNGDNQGVLIALNMMIIAITLVGGWSLFKTGFMFLSRTIVLIILMIISPLAFVSWFIPGMDRGFGRWFSELVNKSFCVCVYLFLIYLLLVILEGSTAGMDTSLNAGQENNTAMMMVFIAVNLGLIFVILGMANKYAKQMCEGDAGIGSKALSLTMGAAATMATGGAAAAGWGARATVGRWGKNVVSGKAKGNAGYWNQKAAELTSSNSRFKSAMGNLLYDIGNKASDARFGTGEGYRSKLKKESSERINRANAIANLSKDNIRSQVEAEEREKVANQERIRMSGLAPESSEYKQLRNQAVNKLREEGGSLTDSNVRKTLDDIMTNRAQEAGKSADIDQEKVNDEVATRTKKQAQEFLQRGQGSPVDWALAGGVGAYNEAADSFEGIGKADDRKTRERAQQIETKSRLATQNQMKVNEMESTTEKLLDVLTDDDHGIMLDERTIESLTSSNNQDFNKLEDILKESLTYKRVDQQGNESMHFDQKTYDKVMGTLETDMNNLTRFQTDAQEVNTEYKTAKQEYEQVMQDESSSQEEKNRARGALNVARRERDKIRENVQSAARGSYKKAIDTARSGLKTKLDTEVALGTAEQLFAAQEGTDIGDQYREGIATEVDVEEGLKH